MREVKHGIKYAFALLQEDGTIDIMDKNFANLFEFKDRVGDKSLNSNQQFSNFWFINEVLNLHYLSKAGVEYQPKLPKDYENLKHAILSPDTISHAEELNNNNLDDQGAPFYNQAQDLNLAQKSESFITNISTDRGLLSSARNQNTAFQSVANSFNLNNFKSSNNLNPIIPRHKHIMSDFDSNFDGDVGLEYANTPRSRQSLSKKLTTQEVIICLEEGTLLPHDKRLLEDNEIMKAVAKKLIENSYLSFWKPKSDVKIPRGTSPDNPKYYHKMCTELFFGGRVYNERDLAKFMVFTDRFEDELQAQQKKKKNNNQDKESVGDEDSSIGFLEVITKPGNIIKNL